MDIEAVDSASLAEWTAFLQSYAHGGSPADTPPPMPLLPVDLREKISRPTPTPWRHNLTDTPLYSSTSITSDIAKDIRLFYAENGFLPPPRSPHEEQRERCILDYNLYSVEQKFNIKAATEMIALFFPDTLVTFSLFHDRMQTHFALSGSEDLIQRYQLSVGLRIPAEDSLCGHAVLMNDHMLYVPNLETDWRYIKNPFVLAGFKSFIGSAITLQRDPTGNPDNRIGIGTINICFTDDFAKITEPQRKAVKQMSRMLETQMRATWEGHSRTREAKAKTAISEFIEEALVDTSGTFATLAERAIWKLGNVLDEVNCWQIIDTRGQVNETTASNIQVTPIPDAIVNSLLKSDQITFHSAASLDHNHATQSGLEPYLPSDTTSHQLVSLFTLDEPLFVIIASTSKPHYIFPSADVNIIRSIGSILRAKAVQTRVIEADAAKTTFLSSISHELRTPMHAIMTGLDLMKKAVGDGDWDEAQTLTAMTESSGRTLQNILNDVLDFGRNANAFNRHTTVSIVDLAESAVAIAKVCMDQILKHGVLFSVEYEDRNWEASIDVARFNRILINGLTNAMKFCKSGSITLSLTSNPEDSEVVIKVCDTGMGFDESSLPRLLQPFTKNDSHSAGAGLGLYITRSLADKMGGTLTLRSTIGKGTTFTVTIPAKLEPRYGIGMKQVTLSGPSPLISPEPLNSTIIEPLRVLIVDDNAILRKLLRMALKRSPVQVHTAEAEDGQHALQIFADLRPDLVLTDVSMPVMDGITSAGHMRRISEELNLPRCRIYAITGLGSSDPRMHSLGMNGTAALDGWMIKGQDQLDDIYGILAELHQAKQAIPPRANDLRSLPLEGLKL